MKIWQLISKKSLKQYEQSESVLSADQVKIKISKVMLTKSDALVYDGTITVNYPFTPCSYAVGRITECGENCKAYTRNSRVLLHATAVDAQDNLIFLGVNKHGYLRDFACAVPEDFSVLPASVSDDEALFGGLVATAEAVLNKLNVDKGQFVAVSGGSIFGIVISQILLYYKIIPVLIDSDKYRLELAKKCGVFYAYAPDENLERSVFEITGGRMCEAGVYCNMTNKTPSATLLNLVMQNASIVFAGLYDKTMNIDSSIITKKQLTICGVYSGEGFEQSAINTLANKAINIANFEKTYSTMEQVPEVFSRLSDFEKAESPLEIITL